jgi:hypothetical protein
VAVQQASLLSPVRQDTERGFIIRFVLLALAVGLVISVAGAAGLGNVSDFAVPAAAAVLVAAVFVFRPVEALLFIGLFVLFYDTVALWLGAQVRQLDEISIAMVALIAFARAAGSWRGWLWLPREGGFALVVVAGIVSSLVSGVPFKIWLPALVLLVKSASFLYAATWTGYRTWEIRGAMRIVLVAGVIVLAFGFFQFAAPGWYQWVTGLPGFYGIRGGLPVVTSIFVHPALFGWFTALVALFAFAAYLTTRRRIWLFASLAFSLGPLLSARRRAILALLAGLGTAFVESTRRLRTRPALVQAWWPVAAGCLALAILFAPLFVGLVQLTEKGYLGAVPGQSLDPATDLPGSELYADNPQARVALYMGSLDIGRDYLPLGAGLGRYGSWMSRVEYSDLYVTYGLSDIRGLQPTNSKYATDTFWPQILGETGVFGVIGYVVFLGSLGIILWREAGRETDPLLRILMLGAGMVFAQSIVESLASSMYNSPPRVYLLYLAVGAVMSIAWRRRQAAREG